MPHYSTRLKGQRERIRHSVQQGLMPRIVGDYLDAIIADIQDIYRKFRGAGETPETFDIGGGGMGGAAAGSVCQVQFVAEKLVVPMQDVMHPKFEHDSLVRYLCGVNGHVTLSRIVGSLWIERHDTQEQHRYYIDLRPARGHRQHLNPGSLLGFSLGFGRYGDERLRLRIDSYEYKRSGGVEITSLSSELHSSCKWMSPETLLTEGLLAAYTGPGLRCIANFTVWA